MGTNNWVIFGLLYRYVNYVIVLYFKRRVSGGGLHSEGSAEGL